MSDQHHKRYDRVLKRPPQGWARKPHEDAFELSLFVGVFIGAGICVNFFYWAGVELINGLGFY